MDTEEKNRWQQGYNLPGAWLTISQTCRKRSGQFSKPCGHQTGDELCIALCCTQDEIGFPKKPSPDGVKCDDKKYCFNGKCIPNPSYVFTK